MKFQYKPLLKASKVMLRKHFPEILTGVGIVTGMIVTPIMVVKVTPKAIEAIHEESARNHDGDEFAATKMEAVKASWKYYAPFVITEAISIACIVGASRHNMKRNAALATAYALSESNLKEYRDKVLEQVGAKKENEIQDSMAQDRLNRNPASGCDIFETGNGTTLCYDVLSGRYFHSNIEPLRKAQNDLNRRMMLNDSVSLNEMYSEIGLPEIELGDEFGWAVQRGYINFDFRTMLSDNDTPCLVLAHHERPFVGYQNCI